MGWGGWGGRWAKAAFQTQWDQLLCQRSRQWSPNHTTRQSRLSDKVMDDWEQFHTNATLLKPAKHVTVLSELYSVMRKPSGKADLAICSHSVVVSG